MVVMGEYATRGRLRLVCVRYTWSSWVSVCTLHVVVMGECMYTTQRRHEWVHVRYTWWSRVSVCTLQVMVMGECMYATRGRHG